MTYLELQAVLNDGGVRNRIQAAVMRAAYNVTNEATDTPNHTNRLTWARAIPHEIDAKDDGYTRMVAGAYYQNNPAHTPEQLTGMSDGTLQSFVDALVNVFAGV